MSYEVEGNEIHAFSGDFPKMYYKLDLIAFQSVVGKYEKWIQGSKGHS